MRATDAIGHGCASPTHEEIQGILYAADEAPEAAVNAGGSEA